MRATVELYDAWTEMTRMVATKRWTLDELVAEFGFDVPFEVVDGELHEVSPCSADPSRVGLRIGAAILSFNEIHDVGEVFGADGGFILSSEPLILASPDVGFVRWENIPPDFDFQSFVPGAPDLAVEVVSPTDRQGQVDAKIDRYLQYGSSLIWRIEPSVRMARIYRPGRETQFLSMNDVLDGEDILPDFRLPMARLFNRSDRRRPRIRPR